VSRSQLQLDRKPLGPLWVLRHGATLPQDVVVAKDLKPHGAVDVRGRDTNQDDASLDLLASYGPGGSSPRCPLAEPPVAHLPYVIIFNLPRLICTSDGVTFI
jgi:hypothetical protein